MSGTEAGCAPRNSSPRQNAPGGLRLLQTEDSALPGGGVRATSSASCCGARMPLHSISVLSGMSSPRRFRNAIAKQWQPDSATRPNGDEPGHGLAWRQSATCLVGECDALSEPAAPAGEPGQGREDTARSHNLAMGRLSAAGVQQAAHAGNNTPPSQSPKTLN